MKKPFFPMFVDLSEKRIVIVGGGKVAARRACTLAAFASDILVAAPEAEQEIRQLEQDGVLQWYRGTYHESLLDTADIVLAATNDAALNEEVARCCRKRGILVNTSHKKELCDFYFPAVAIQQCCGRNHSQRPGSCQSQKGGREDTAGVKRFRKRGYKYK